MPLGFHSPEEWTRGLAPGLAPFFPVGNFDGLHLGHQKILRMVLARLRRARGTLRRPLRSILIR